MSKAPICSLRIKRCLMRKRFASRGVCFGERRFEAVNKEWMQRWTT